MRTAALAAAAVFLLAAWTPFPSSVGPEVPLDAPPYAPTFTTEPRLAASAEGALLLSEQLTVSRIGEIFQLHYTGALDGNGLPIGESSALGYVRNASVASSGRGYLVAFEQDGEARAVRFTSAGTRIDATPISLGVRGGVGEVAWDGTAYVVVAASKAISVGEDGRVLATRDAFNFATNAQVAARNGVAIAVNQGSNFEPTGPLQAQVIGGALHRLGSGASSDIAAGDPGFLLVYESNGAIASRLFDPSGQPDGPQFLIASAGRDPVVAWNGTNWVVAYEVGETVRAAHVLRGPLGPATIVTTNGINPTIAAHGGRVLIAWDSRVPRTVSEIRTASIEGTDVNVTATAAGRTSRAQTDVRMTTVDGATLLAWYDGAARVRRMDGKSAAQTIEDVGSPMAFAGGDGSALVVSRLGNTLAFTRVDRNGAPLSTQRFTAAALVDVADAVWTGNLWTVIWHVTGPNSGLYRASVSADGTLSGPRPFGPIVSASTQGLTVTKAADKVLVLWSVAGGGTHTFVMNEQGLWAQGRGIAERMFEAASTGGPEVLAARIREDNVLEWQRVFLDGRVGARSEVALPEAGMTLQTFFTGENFLLVLTRAGAAPDRIDLYGLRVDVSGAPIDPAPVHFESAYTVLPPAFATANLRNGTTLDLAYFRALDEAGMFHEFPRLVFRSVHDSPRRRVVR